MANKDDQNSKPTTTVVVVSHVPLDERNGAGMRVLIQYLAALPRVKVLSLHTCHTVQQGQHSLPTVDYLGLPRAWYLRPLHTLSTIRNFLAETSGPVAWLCLPNDVHDCLLGWLGTFFFEKSLVWTMDDFVSEPPRAGLRGAIKHFASRVFFRQLYRGAWQRIVISPTMQKEYEQRYGKRAQQVLGKTWSQARMGALSATRNPQRLVWIGNFQPFYSAPLKGISEILKQHSNLAIQIDIYGQHSPPAEILIPDRVNYRGAFSDADLPAILAQYDMGLLTYSFDETTKGMMRLSFPSKLVDYLAAGLAVATIAPQDLSIVAELEKRAIGPVTTSLATSQLLRFLESLLNTPDEKIQAWKKKSLQWAKDEFVFESGIRRIEKTLNL